MSMSEELKRIIESKREYRIRLASLPIAEKLRMLEALRDRQLAIRGGGVSPNAASSQMTEGSPRRGTKPE